jgi:hypothetical protein
MTERKRQREKHGDGPSDILNRDPFCAIAVLTEELGEASQQLLEERFALDDRRLSAAWCHRMNARKELVEVAAVAVAMIEAIDCEPAWLDERYADRQVEITHATEDDLR